ncbi:hypothetical protein PINS_up022473 [Pythium insidiosum]|nr:hypothetical protein PINS_up022473 [Pythium insidiosum]
MQRSSLVVALLFVLMATAIAAQDLEPEIIEFDEDTSDHAGCEFDEIQLASDGIIQLRRLEMGERVAPNTTLNSSVERHDYEFFHLCVMRHEHEHQINVNLTCLDHGTDANLYLSSVEKYPRMGHASWIAQHVGDDHVRLFTYLDGFPRKSDPRHRSIPLHIGVRGVSPLTRYNLTVSVLDLPITKQIQERERYYTQRHLYDQQHHPVHQHPPSQVEVARRLRH